jgi:cytochrome c556
MQHVKKAGWRTPPDHPDVDPPHEATILAEMYRELARTDEVKARPEDFRSWLAAGERSAWDLSSALKASDARAAAASYQAVEASCAACHAKYRDNR